MMGIIRATCPPLNQDIKIVYRGLTYTGYYEGDGQYRVFTSLDGKDDVYTSEIDGWRYDGEEARAQAGAKEG